MPSKDPLYKARKGIVEILQSGMIFTNRKTDFCVELNFCPLMKLEKRGDKKVFTTPKCKGCYAADMLNISKGLRNKIARIPKDKTELLEIFERDIILLLQMARITELGEIKRIRFYGLTDFHKDNIPFIKIASKYLIVDIISKTLVMKHNEQELRELINQPNIWISLSFNKDFKKDIPRIIRLLKETNARNVQLNYCLNTHDEDISDPWFDQFQVIHQRDLDKFNAHANGIDKSRICGIYDRDGNELPPKAKGAHCRNCGNCHVSYLEATEKKELAFSSCVGP